MFPFYTALIVCVLCGVVASIFAKQRGRSPISWFFIGFFFQFFGVLFLLVLPVKRDAAQLSNAQPVRSSPLSAPAQPVTPPVTSHASPAENLSDEHRIERCKMTSWYFIDRDHQRIGPLTYYAMTKAYQERRIMPNTPVWNENDTEWGELQAHRYYSVLYLEIT